jgi:hypothetical protein
LVGDAQRAFVRLGVQGQENCAERCLDGEAFSVLPQGLRRYLSDVNRVARPVDAGNHAELVAAHPEDRTVAVHAGGKVVC